jgi:hypothetical protein
LYIVAGFIRAVAVSGVAALRIATASLRLDDSPTAEASLLSSSVGSRGEPTAEAKPACSLQNLRFWRLPRQARFRFLIKLKQFYQESELNMASSRKAGKFCAPGRLPRKPPRQKKFCIGEMRADGRKVWNMKFYQTKFFLSGT